MSGIQKIKNILESEVYSLENGKEISLTSDDNGVIDPLQLDVAKSLLLVESIDDINKNLINAKLAYPSKGKRKAHIFTDLILMEGEVYRELLNLLDGIKETR